MSRILLIFVLAATLASCATRTVTKETCQPQFPPGPCVDGPQEAPKGK